MKLTTTVSSLHLFLICFTTFHLLSTRVVLSDDEQPEDNTDGEPDYYDDPSAITNSSAASSGDCPESGGSILSTLTAVHNTNRHLPVESRVSHLNETMAVIDHLVNLTHSLIATELTPEQMGVIMDFFYTLNVTDGCFFALTSVARGILEQRIWAFKFIDALGKVPTGIAEGSIAHFGEFDECLEIESPADEPIAVRGQYCLAKFILPYPSLASYRPSTPLYGRRHYEYLVSFFRVYNLDNYFTLGKFVELLNNQKGATFRLGVCFPSACSPDEIEGLINQIIFPILKMPVRLQPDCFSAEEVHGFDAFELTALTIIATILLINVVCTILDHVFPEDKSTPTCSRARSWLRESIKCFSLVRNLKALFDLDKEHAANLCKICAVCTKSQAKLATETRAGSSDRRFAFLDAIRLILVINVCIDHMFLFTPFMSFMAFKRILNSVITKVYYYNRYFFARNILIIDTLFIISGLVLSYSLLRRLALNGGKIHYGVFLVRLWLKYTLPMGAVILLFWLLPLTGDGPIWKVGMNLLVPACKDSFSLLSSFTYLSNYRIKATQNVFNFDPQFAVCNPPTWFLSALFQLQILGPLFVYLIYRNAKYGLLVSGSLVLFGAYASISPNHLFGQPTYLDGLTISSIEEMVKAFVAFHMGINQYIVGFFIGIIVGYLVSHQLIYQRFNLSKRTEVILWTVSFVALSSVMFWFNTLHRINQPIPRLSILLWFSVGKLIACIAIGWMLYALCVGRAVLVEQIFSLSFFRILSRLSFGIYLLHFIPLSHRLFAVRDTYVMTSKILFEYIVVDFIQTTLMASIFNITIERPFNSLLSLLFNKNEFEDIFGKDSEPSEPADERNVPSLSPPMTSTVSAPCTPDTITARRANSGTILTAVGSGTGAACLSAPSLTNVNGGAITSCSPINHHLIKSSLPSVNLFAANCHEVYLVSKKP